MKKNVILSILFLFISVIGFAQSYGSYCDTCVYQLSRDSLNRPAFQGGKPISPPVHQATMMMMNRKHYRDFLAIQQLLALKASIDSVVTISNTQTILGKKTFADTIVASKGLRSSGLIDTKGLSTEGTSSKPSATFNGVQKIKRRLIIANTNLDGTDFWLEIQCSSSDITIQLPSITASDGWKFDIIRTDDTTHVVKFQRPDGSFIRILNKRSAILRNNGSQWSFD